MSKELKPCPFCGGKVKLLSCDGIEDGIPFVISSEEEYDNNYCYVHCYECDTDFMHDSDNARDVIEAWNRRVDNA